MVESELALLRDRGHAVEAYLRHNDEVAGVSRARLAVGALWSSQTIRDVERLAEQFRPDVIHVHNTLPLVSPSVFWGAARVGVPVVQTLHNFRMMCPQAMFVRQGQICEDCLGKVPWRGVVRACYRESVAQSAVVAATSVWHRSMGTYQSKVDRYIALNEFCRAKFVAGGLPADRVVIKPNFVQTTVEPVFGERQGGLYLGRLTQEKGVPQLLAALDKAELMAEFTVAGGGVLECDVAAALGSRYVGFQPAEAVAGLLARAAYLVVPSVWYEGFPRTIVEAYAAGVPVIASRLGSLAEIVRDGQTGMLFDPGNVDDLAAKLQWAQSHPQALRAMGQAARQTYEEHYTPERNYAQLLRIYESVLS